MQRYFINPDNMHGKEVYIDKEDAKHISKVMRFQEGDRIICLDNEGFQAVCRITAISQSTVVTEIEKTLDADPELPVRTIIAQALIKGDKLDYVIQKGTEFGASAFCLYESQRSVVKWDSSKSQKKLERLKKIAKEAAEQAERLYIPDIYYYKSLDHLLTEESLYDKKIALHEEKARDNSHEGISHLLNSDFTSLLAVIGPEGGLSENETQTLNTHDVYSVSLGPRILRSESASLFLLAVLSYQFELSR